MVTCGGVWWCVVMVNVVVYIDDVCWYRWCVVVCGGVRWWCVVVYDANDVVVVCVGDVW